MTGLEDGTFGIGGDAHHPRPATGAHFQFIGHCARFKLSGRTAFRSVQSLDAAVVHSALRTPDVSIKPLQRHDTMFARSGSGRHCRSGRSLVARNKGVVSLQVDTPLLEKQLQTIAAVKGREGFQIVRLQLVDHNVHDQSRHPLRSLTHNTPFALHFGRSQEREQG